MTFEYIFDGIIEDRWFDVGKFLWKGYDKESIIDTLMKKYGTK